MSVNSIAKQISRIEEVLEGWSEVRDRKVLIITDSKGRYRSRHLERRDSLEIV